MTTSGPKVTSAQTPEVIAIHGFLGLARDWNAFGYTGVDLWPSAKALGQTANRAMLHSVGQSVDCKDDHFEIWAKRFNDRFVVGRVENGVKPWLLGYSLGGRLAMHAVLMRPELFSGAVFVSANPGLKNESEREERRTQDKKWSERFQTEKWNQLIEDWNNQPVLKSPEGLAHRAEHQNTDFDREALAAALNIWSLGRQQDLSQRLASLTIPVLYITGNADHKFTEIVSTIKRAANHAHQVIAGSGHRVPWDRPREFSEAVRRFMLS